MQATYLTAGALVALMRLTWLETWRKKKFAWYVTCANAQKGNGMLLISYKLKPLLFLRRHSETAKCIS